MAGNSFGSIFRFTTWGESHGPAIGVVVDGVPSRLPLSEDDIQPYLDRRRPGQSRFTTQRREPDRVEILSGVYQGLTTGAPVSLIIRNEDVKSKDYSDIADSFRPGHADFSWNAKFGHRDPRGGGRTSARETAARVAAGAIARLILGDTVVIRAGVVQLGPHKIDRARLDWNQVAENPMFCPDPVAAAAWETYLDAIRKSGNSIGAIVEVEAKGVPAGWGEPVYDKLDSDLARAFMSINAVKGVEIGDGFGVAALTGEENADEIRIDTDGQPVFLSNHAGGVLGGISTGQSIIARMALKPTSSILIPRRTITSDRQETDIITKGRHDPCVGIRAAPVAEAMMAVVLADHKLRHAALSA